MKESNNERQARMAAALRENLRKRKAQQKSRVAQQNIVKTTDAQKISGAEEMQHKDQVTAAILVIGDEILSGRTKDTNINFIANQCTGLGISLKEVRVVPDDEAMIIEYVNVLREKYTYLFTTGGIGATHDDITASCIAKAFDVPFEINQEAMKIIADYYQERLNDVRKRMAWMPRGCTLVSNPVSTVPTFQIENVFALAGMPKVMHGMFEAIIPRLAKGPKMYSNSLTSSAVEGEIGALLSDLQKQFTGVSIGSYPFYDYPNIGTTVVVRSIDTTLLKAATIGVEKMLKDLGKDQIKCDFSVEIE